MSLLMDALRRAEAEKRQQEARATKTPHADAPAAGNAAGNMEVVAPVAGSEDVTVKAESAPAGERTPDAGSDDAGPEVAPAAAADAHEQHDSGEFGLPEGLSLEPLEGEKTFAGFAADDTRTGTMDESAVPAAGAGARARPQSATLPSNRAVRHDLDAYFEPSRSMEMPRRTAPGDATLEDVAAHTMVGAQTVFAAAERPRSRQILLIAAVFGLAIVVGIGALGVFFAQQAPGQRRIPSPTVADGVERTAARELPVVPVESRTAQALPGLVRIDTQAPVAPDPATAGMSAGAPALAAAPASPTPEGPAATEVPPAPDPPAAPAEKAAVAAQPSPARAPAPAGPADAGPEADVGAGEVRIARSVRPAGVDADITAAYEAFSRGDVDAAESLYGAAIAANPDRRDALLGLGAIALGKGDLDRAYRHYATVLNRFPGDPVASAALLSLIGDNGGTTAARLRMLRDSNRESPYIHFALGNWYARQGRWPDAQQSYFEAVRLDASNADYNYNLAISLDHMGQNEAALEYYRKSLVLADNSSASFNPSNVLERIGSLSAAHDP